MRSVVDHDVKLSWSLVWRSGGGGFVGLEMGFGDHLFLRLVSATTVKKAYFFAFDRI